jgi:hypothetical protein
MPSRPLLPSEKNLLQIAETNSEVLEELRTICQMLKTATGNKQIRRTSTVNEFVGTLLMKDPYRDWTSVSIGKEIGCTAAVVRKTKQCMAYQEHCTHSRAGNCVSRF